MDSQDKPSSQSHKRPFFSKTRGTEDEQYIALILSQLSSPSDLSVPKAPDFKKKKMVPIKNRQLDLSGYIKILEPFIETHPNVNGTNTNYPKELVYVTCYLYHKIGPYKKVGRALGISGFSVGSILSANQDISKEMGKWIRDSQ